MIRTYYNDAEVSSDIMHVNSVPFLTLVSEYIYYIIVNTIDNMEIDTLEFELKNVVRVYAIRGFNVVVILVDIQFKALKDHNKVGILISIASSSEYVI